MPTVNVGDAVSITAKVSASKPKWMTWTGATSITGTAKLPSGHRRLVSLATSNARTDDDYYVVPSSMPLTDAPWRATIFAPNGSYITSTGRGDIPTIGTPVVRIGVNTPSKAVIKYPALKKSPQNILASTFKEWSDGHTEAVDRGMEVAVEYRDATSGSMVTVFRGMIYQIESADTVTITAYDRMMDLAQYSDQYQSHAGYTQNDTSRSRTISGDDYIYQMNNAVGTLLSANAVNEISIDCLSTQTWDYSHTKYQYYIRHPLPSCDGYSVTQGHRIRQLSVKYSAYYVWTNLGTHTVSVSGKFILYRNGNVVAETSMAEFIHKTVQNTTNITAEGTLTINMDWSIDGSPSEYMIGAYVEGPPNGVAGSEFGYDYTSSFNTVSSVYQSDNGSGWTQLTGDHPEIAVKFTHAGGAVSTSSITVSGSSLTVSRFNIPDGPWTTYVTTVDKGVQMIVSYFITGAAGLQGIIEELIKWAGLVPDVPNENMGQTTYYTSSTYDYMTCLQELLKSGNYGIKTTVEEPGKIYVRKKHTISETPVATFSTDPADHGTYEETITAHRLTAHWMAEKATQAYIAENATSSNLPIALETDDALMPNSLVEIMQCPLRSIIADSTLGTHDLLANAAEGKMVQLHTNVFEGSMVLAGYRLDIWDFTTNNCGGQPIGIRVPEYGAQGTAVPTEIILGDNVTQISLDNIRTADRSEVANSMGLSADAISNNAGTLPNTVYVFGRAISYSGLDLASLGGSIAAVSLVDPNTQLLYTQYSSAYIKVVKDTVGYTHILTVCRTEDQPGGFAPSVPIERILITGSDGTLMYVALDNPKYAYDGQNVHVDIRFNTA